MPAELIILVTIRMEIPVRSEFKIIGELRRIISAVLSQPFSALEKSLCPPEKFAVFFKKKTGLFLR